MFYEIDKPKIKINSDLACWDIRNIIKHIYQSWLEKDRQMPTGERLIYRVLKYIQNKICDISLSFLVLVPSVIVITCLQNYYLKTYS